MKVLAIKQPWASLIAEGQKTIEVRSRHTNIRERVAIYATISPYDKRANVDLGMFMPRGYIVATVDIVDCVKYASGLGFLGDADNHMIPCENIDVEQFVGHYGWHLDNVEMLETPIEFKMPKGCVVWANADI